MSEVNQNQANAAKGIGVGGKIAIAVACTAAVLAGGYAFLCTQVKEDTVLPKTTVNGVELGGLTQAEAEEALNKAFEERLANAELGVAVDGKTYSVQVGDTLTMDTQAAVETVMKPNKNSFLTRGVSFVKAHAMGSDIKQLPELADGEKLSTHIQESGLMDINTTVQSTYKVNKKTKDLDIVKGITGHSVDEAALTELIYAAVAADDYETVIECPMITGEVKPLDWNKIRKKVCKESSDATLTLSQDRRNYEIVESVTSVDFDTDAAKKDFEEAEEGKTVTIKLVYTEPEITTENLKNNLFQDRLSAYDTKVGGTDGRKSNVRLAGEKINGIILLPGDSFSYNNTLGQRTAENGFYQAPAYFNGETVQEYGGGICQMSSTLYSATLYANLQIDERHNHTYASSYIGLGMDATVSWGGPDFQFTNNQKYPIKLVAGMWNGYATVEILGTKTNSNKVEIRSETLETKPFSTETKTDSTMEEGKSYYEQHGVDGYRVQTYRIIKDADGKVLSETKESFSTYTPEKEIVVIGTKKKEVPKPVTPTNTKTDSKTDKKKTTKKKTTNKTTNKKTTTNKTTNDKTTTDKTPA